MPDDIHPDNPVQRAESRSLQGMAHIAGLANDRVGLQDGHSFGRKFVGDPYQLVRTSAEGNETTQGRDPESFRDFEKGVQALGEELRTFPYSMRQLQPGSSGRILISSTYDFRKRLAQILFLFHQNAASVFPRMIQAPAMKTWDSGFDRQMKNFNALRIEVDQKGLTTDCLPDQIEELANDIKKFMESMSEFPEFKDDAINTALETFESQLEYWAVCLRDLTLGGRYDAHAVQVYVHDLSSELKSHVDDTISALQAFIKMGVPFIQSSKRNGLRNLLNLSTVATVFSAVSATTMQFSYPLADSNAVSIAVNCFWFASLVFSIAAAVNSLLIVAWRQAAYRSPKRDVPWLILVVLRISPLVFLAMSVACFSIGLCCFSFASSQSLVTSALTIILTVITNLSIILLSMWLTVERYSSCDNYRTAHMGLHYQDESLSGVLAKPLRCSFIGQGHQALSELITKISHAFSRTTSGGNNDLESIRVSTTREESLKPVVLVHDSESGDNLSSLPDLWRRLHSRFRTPVPSRGATRQATISPSSSTAVSPTPANSAQKLASMQEVLCIPVHHALVRHLRFSANGKYLATNGFDRMSTVCEVNNTGIGKEKELKHTEFVRQIAWSPNPKEDVLLTQYTRSMKLWHAETGTCFQTIERGGRVESIAWFPDGRAFLCVELDFAGDIVCTKITKLSNKGKFLDAYYLYDVRLHSVAVTPDCERFIGIGQWLSFRDDPSASLSDSKANRKLYVYNMRTERLESEAQCPPGSARSIAISRHEEESVLVLINFSDKTSPQCWKMQYFIDAFDYVDMAGRMEHFHTYTVDPQQQPEFSAEMSCFGGSDDELVLCTGRLGEINIWNTQTGQALRHIKPTGENSHIASFAWNHALGDPFMFALCRHGGVVCLWTSVDPPNARTLVGEGSGSGEAGPSSSARMQYTSQRTESPKQVAFALPATGTE